MPNKEADKPHDELSSKPTSGDAVQDPLADTNEVTAQTVPTGVDRRTFLMRSAVVGATAVMTGKIISAQERTGRSIAIPPTMSDKTGPPPPLSKDLNVVKKGQGPVMTTIDEFYKVGPGPSSSHTIGPARQQTSRG